MAMMEMLLAATLVQAPLRDFSQLHVFATVERRPSFETTTRVRIGTFQGGIIPAGEKVTYWFVREREDPEGRVADRASADTETCPASLGFLRRLEHLRLPSPDVPGYRRDHHVIVTDGIYYRLEGTSRHSDNQPGSFSITSNAGTPLAEWTDRLFDSLHRCWRPLP